MSLRAASLAFLAAALLSACDFWPKNLDSLAEKIGQQVSGDVEAWVLGGDVLVINVEGSPLYHEDREKLESLATGIAEQSATFVEDPLESMIVTFYEGKITEDSDRQHEFIFLLREGRPVFYPTVDFDASGPLRPGEVRAAVAGFESSSEQQDGFMTDERKTCVLEQAQDIAIKAGDPELLDPTQVAFLDADSWKWLDAGTRRILLSQSIATEAMFRCIGGEPLGPGTH